MGAWQCSSGGGRGGGGGGGGGVVRVDQINGISESETRIWRHLYLMQW